MSTEEALQVIHDGRGSHFDPEVVDIFLNYLSNTKTDYNGKAEELTFQYYDQRLGEG